MKVPPVRSIEAVSGAYAWQRALGHETMQDSLCCIVRDLAHPDVWDANHVSGVRARTAAEIDAVASSPAIARSPQSTSSSLHAKTAWTARTAPAFSARVGSPWSRTCSRIRRFAGEESPRP